jgi:hypothetical protein
LRRASRDVAHADAWGEHIEERRGKATRTIGKVTDRQFMVQPRTVRYDLSMLPWNLRSAVLATTVAFVLGACGDAFTQADATDASTTGPGDGGASDGSAMGDGGATADATDMSFCSKQTVMHLFCDDFDDRSGAASTTVQGKWSPGETQSASASATIDDAAAATPSPPNSFLAQTTAPILTKTETVAVLSENVGHLGATHLLQASFEMLVASYGANELPDDSADVYVVSIGALVYALLLSDATHASFVEVSQVDASAPAVHPLAAAFAANTWTQTSILLRAPTPSAVGHVTISLTAAGQTMIKALDEDLVIPTDVSGAAATVSIGVNLTLSPMNWAVRFDNVVFDTL